MTKEEISRAAEELDERIEGKRTEKVDDPSVVELLGKAMDYILRRNNNEEEKVSKSEAELAEEAEAVKKAQANGEEKFYEKVTEDTEDLQGMIDAAPALEALTDAIAKSMGVYEVISKSQAEQGQRLEMLETAIVPLLKGMEAVVEIMKSVRDQPVSRTSPGFVFAPAGRDGEKETGSVPENFREKLYKAVAAEKVEPKYLQWLDSRGEEETFRLLPAGSLD